MRKAFCRSLLAATALGALALGAATGIAEARTNRALIVAVTKYPNFPEKNWLVGPNHDSRLVREYLEANDIAPFDAGNVTVLADGVDGAKSSPTHAAILGELKTLADESQAGDFVYIHFSGHGSQQPELVKGSETDGLDEIFLPSDTELWRDRTTGVPNALMDDEIGAALDAIRAKGAFVWFVVDACHSGTATRDVVPDSDFVHERELDPVNDLKVAPEAMAEAEKEAAPASRGVGSERESAFALSDDSGESDGKKGGLVAFYAAQTTETTPERPMPRGQDGATSYGVFTYTLFQRIAENPGMTYRQLGQAILQQYAADSQTKPTPLFEGDLDARVFGSEKIDMVMQWPVKVKGGKATLNAGLLQRLAPGSKLAILPSPTSELKDTLGYLEVTSAKNLSSEVRPVESDGRPALELSAIPPQAYARLSDMALDFRLKVARPAADAKLSGQVAQVNRVLDALAANPEKRFNIELVDPGKDADLRLAVLPENQVTRASDGAGDKPALWFLPPSGQISAKEDSRPPLVGIDEADPKKLEDATAANLQKIFRATSLARLAVASDYQPDQVNVSFRVKREDKDAMEPLDGSTVPYVHPGDEVHILAENKSNKRVDINVLYIGSDYSITHITAQRLEAGARLDEGLLAFTDDSFGLERMVAVLTEAPPGSETEDLSFLAQDKVPSASRDVGDQRGFGAMLDQIAAAPSSRGAAAFKVNGGDAPKGGVMIFTVETEPKNQ